MEDQLHAYQLRYNNQIGNMKPEADRRQNNGQQPQQPEDGPEA